MLKCRDLWCGMSAISRELHAYDPHEMLVRSFLRPLHTILTEVLQQLIVGVTAMPHGAVEIIDLYGRRVEITRWTMPSTLPTSSG